MYLFSDFLNRFFEELVKEAKISSNEKNKTENGSMEVKTDEMNSEVVRKVDGQNYSVCSSVHCVNDDNGSVYEISYTFIRAKVEDADAINTNISNICDSFDLLFRELGVSDATLSIKFDDTCDGSFDDITLEWNNEIKEFKNKNGVYNRHSHKFVANNNDMLGCVPTNQDMLGCVGHQNVESKKKMMLNTESVPESKVVATIESDNICGGAPDRKKMAFNLKSNIDSKMKEDFANEDEEFSCEYCDAIFCPDIALDLLYDYIGDNEEDMYTPIFDDDSEAVAIKVYASDLCSPENYDADDVYHHESYLLDQFCNDVCEDFGFSKAIWELVRENTGKDDILDEEIEDIVFTIYF